MSLPITRQIPPVPDFEDLEGVKKYLQDLHYDLQDMYGGMTQNINGFFRNPEDEDGSQWIPTVRGSTNAGTISYTRQSGWVLRQGIITEIWFQVGWTSIGAASGLLHLDLPYKITKYDSDQGNVFVGAAMSGSTPSSHPTGLSYPSGRTFIATVGLPETFFAKFEAGGSGEASSPVSIGANAYIAGNLRYIGVEDE